IRQLGTLADLRAADRNVASGLAVDFNGRFTTHGKLTVRFSTNSNTDDPQAGAADGNFNISAGWAIDNVLCPGIDLAGFRITTPVEIDRRIAAVGQRKADTVRAPGQDSRHRIFRVAPGFRPIVSSMPSRICRTERRFCPLLLTLFVAGEYPTPNHKATAKK